MNRNAMEELKRWQHDSERKPMVLRGARQVGKTWLMKEFGKKCYNHFVYFNFDEEDELKSVFEKNKNPVRIIELLSSAECVEVFQRKSKRLSCDCSWKFARNITGTTENLSGRHGESVGCFPVEF